MASRLLITQSAEEDRDRIMEYLLNDLQSQQAAGHFLDEMEQTLARICDYLELCALSQDAHLARLGYCTCRFMNYLLVYVFDKAADTVTLGRIFHTRQDYAKLV